MQLFEKQKDLFIFDVDGVILDLWDRFEEHCLFAAEYAKLSIPNLKAWFSDIQNGNGQIKASLQESAKVIWPGITTEGIDAYAQGVAEWEKSNSYPLIQGSLETIQGLREQDVKIALCTTNSERSLADRFEKVGVDIARFDAVSTGDWKYRKPDARAFDPIFKKLQIPRENAIYFGDIDGDRTAAEGAGIEFVAVLTGGVPKQFFLDKGVANDHIINSIADLPQLIK